MIMNLYELPAACSFARWNATDWPCIIDLLGLGIDGSVGSRGAEQVEGVTQEAAGWMGGE